MEVLIKWRIYWNWIYMAVPINDIGEVSEILTCGQVGSYGQEYW